MADGGLRNLLFGAEPLPDFFGDLSLTQSQLKPPTQKCFIIKPKPRFIFTHLSIIVDVQHNKSQ